MVQDKTVTAIIFLIAVAIFLGNIEDSSPNPDPLIDAYCQWGDVYVNGEEFQDCWSEIEECQIVNDIPQCVRHDSGGNGGSSSPPPPDPPPPDPDPIDVIGDGSNGLIPTFNSIGISWKPSNMGSNQAAKVQYRSSGGIFKEANNLWFDARGNYEYRGSIVKLNPCTEYEVKLTLSPNGESISNSIKTWCEYFPIESVIDVPASAGTYNIDSGGSKTGFKKYTCNGNTVKNIIARANYIIIDNCKTTGGSNGIDLGSSSYVVVQNNDISGWNKDCGDKCNRRAGIKGGGIWSGSCAGHHIIIQYNRIHDAATGSHSWDDGHPSGSQGIDLSCSDGQNVIRYNEIYNNNGIMFNDVLGGERNKGQKGFPSANSDIYGNYLADCWDDAIEAEGSGENVRIYENYMDNFAIGIATVDVNIGPLYAFRNVFDSSYRSAGNKGKSGIAFKLGDLDSQLNGRRYILHNTVLQEREGIGSFVLTTDNIMTDAYVVNNIAPLRSGHDFAHITAKSGGCRSYSDYNLYQGNIWGECSGYENNGIKGTPSYDVSTMYNYPNGRRFDQTIMQNTNGHNDGLIIPNFNDNYEGSAPDLGAVELGREGFCFGVNC